MYYSPDNAAQELSAIAGAMTLRPQGTGDLGRRMGAIVAALGAEGFAHVVLVGADVPTLPDACIPAAFEALDSGAQVAVARADDGGYVSLAVDAPHAELFASIPWSTHLVTKRPCRARESPASRSANCRAGTMLIRQTLARLRLEYSSGTSARIPHTWKALKNLPS